MSKSKIEWTDKVWNPITGCTKVSPGCQNCYAERMSKRLVGRCGYPADEPFRVTLHPERLEEPLKWTKPWKVFVCSMGDLFHEYVDLGFIAQVFNIMASVTADCGKNHKHNEECWTGEPHTFQVLTKRPERMQKALDQLPYYIGEHMPGDSPLSLAMEVGDWPLPNVWLGVTAENQEQADKRIPILLQIPAAVRFVSVEPMLGPVDLMKVPLPPVSNIEREWPGIDWVIAGSENGPKRRSAKLDWFRALRDQCISTNVPFFLKQSEINGKIIKMPTLDNQAWGQFPEVKP